jgi:deoxyinosine 3'endonuclease (endonuclease V)
MATVSNDLDQLLESWRDEQYRIASQVMIKDDNDDDDDGENDNFKYLLPKNYNNSTRPAASSSSSSSSTITSTTTTGSSSKQPCHAGSYFGGVDVSFPDNEESAPSVAVYVIVDHSGTVVYRASECVHLIVPYVSSYLSFREIAPLERLVEQQRADLPALTPSVILVDGNGILHARRAGIACFLGVRTGIPTIGVGKTLYCEGGMDKATVKDGIDRSLEKLRNELDLHLEWKQQLLGKPSGLFVDRVCIDTRDVVSPPDQPFTPLKRQDILNDIASICNGVAVKLKGDKDEILACALLGHGGRIGTKKTRGAKNPIYISVGHAISLEDAVRVCAQLSQACIPEPVRQADLWGRDLLRLAREESKKKAHKIVQ